MNNKIYDIMDRAGLIALFFVFPALIEVMTRGVCHPITQLFLWFLCYCLYLFILSRVNQARLNKKNSTPTNKMQWEDTQ